MDQSAFRGDAMIAWLVGAALALTVTPSGFAFAPAEVRARVSVDVPPAGRTLAVALVSSDHERLSEIPIAPRDTRQTFWLEPWHRVPAGDYLVVVAVLDQAGQILAQTRTTVHIKPGLGDGDHE
jgi:hypothetical protein